MSIGLTASRSGRLVPAGRIASISSISQLAAVSNGEVLRRRLVALQGPTLAERIRAAHSTAAAPHEGAASASSPQARHGGDS